MDETSKSKRLWGELEFSVLKGKGIDIGCGNDPVFPNARCFDLDHGDANAITHHVTEQYDYVYSSHCLEHMKDPRRALSQWWELVRVGGHLFFIVPDEDLYEQGVYPSLFNADHKATFTISKAHSWSPVSINVLQLAQSLPNGRIRSLELQDQGYDRSLLWHGRVPGRRIMRYSSRLFDVLTSRTKFTTGHFQTWNRWRGPIDQTLRSTVVAQIQCIIQKVA